MSIKTELTSIAKKAQGACRSSLTLSSEVKDRALKDMALALLDRKAYILSANQKDLRAAKARGMSLALLDRLTLSEKRIQDMADSLNEIANLPDPVGEVINIWRRPNGLWINKVRVPIGVIAIIYESRPNVTSDCLGLCFKSGNSVILRGGSEAINSNLAIAGTLKGVLKRHKISEGMVNMITTTDRAAVKALLSLNNYIDLVMPRGGESLINQVMKLSRIPVIKHYKGICHVYVDGSADLKMAEDICYNAKVQRPGVCNAMESMLVHQQVASKFLPAMLKNFQDARVEIRGCPVTKKIVKGIKLARESDYRTEYLDLILSVRVVKDLKQAIEHINNYGSHHSDSIITDDYDNSLEFLRRVDSACVYVNASTRFTDGYQFGLGAEIGISTDKLHARGPMALEELTTYKYMVMGSGQVRS
ncbi:MAG: glutamate-5-semialdehyde dehydrogenase [Candidatus Omnitrophota bacterium]|nr:glutamate-5-semialdehyde dehydrogenase [Candidatus Omnitrophota bacterium]MBU1929681.1 glutamate-5-semialdehyde dehydrogenase [Candidatus Omnitrophota bacterium]MBU2034655.1 glutamate-5-semialdehyde dehydrogenase [Candidatus Omnitrophota bacterium]